MGKSVLYAGTEYKNKIINLLYRDKNFIKLVNPVPSKCPDIDIIDVLNGGEWIINGEKWTEVGHVFDYNFVNDTILDKRVFAFVETDISSVSYNTYIDFNLYICLFTSRDLVRLTTTTTPTAKEVQDMGFFATSTTGNRIDALCECVDGILNNSYDLKGIGTVSPDERDYVSIYTPTREYYGKCLKYNITGYNYGSDYCGDQ